MPKRRNEGPKKTPEKIVHVKPMTEGQRYLLEEVLTNDITICTGPSGTGKTRLSIGLAINKLLEKEIKKIVITRPAVYEGKGIGYLPGGITDKMAPFLIPIYDELKNFIDVSKLTSMVGTGNYSSNPPIEIVPIEFMRGRTIKDAFIIVDEAQNCTLSQLKTILTRIGDGSKIVINGDIRQTDLKHEPEGLSTLKKKLSGIKGISVVELTIKDIVRHPIIEDILNALES